MAKKETKPKKKSQTLAIDFDGVIHGYSKGWNGGEIYDPPVEGVAEALQRFKEEGYKIYIYSTRSNKTFRKTDEPEQKPLMEAYLKEHNIPFDKIWNFGKPMAHIFIDDRALKFEGDWKQTTDDVLEYKTWLDKAKEEEE
jgi:ribonucleotide monophosphatase NagD (HAD superfamily)